MVTFVENTPTLIYRTHFANVYPWMSRRIIRLTDIPYVYLYNVSIFCG